MYAYGVECRVSVRDKGMQKEITQQNALYLEQCAIHRHPPITVVVLGTYDNSVVCTRLTFSTGPVQSGYLSTPKYTYVYQTSHIKLYTTRNTTNKH